MKSADKKALFLRAWRALTPADTPEPKDEVPNIIPGRRFVVDFAFIEERIVIEVDGGQWGPHGGYHCRDGDRVRNNLMQYAGWVVVRLSTQQLETDPSPHIADLYAFLQTRLRP